IFGRALERNLFSELDRLDYDLLKFVSDFVRGFEPERCWLWQWERAILDGFTVFRALKQHRRGYVKADLERHTITFEPGPEQEYEYPSKVRRPSPPLHPRLQPATSHAEPRRLSVSKVNRSTNLPIRFGILLF